MPTVLDVLGWVPLAGWACAACALGAVALAAFAAVRRSPPIGATTALGAFAGASFVGVIAREGGLDAALVVDGLAVTAWTWSALAGLVALASWRAREPSRPTPRRAVATLLLAVLASVPVLAIDGSGIFTIAVSAVPSGVVVLALRDSERLAAARRDLGLLQLAAAGVLVVGLAAEGVRGVSSSGLYPRHFEPFALALPALALAIAALLATGVGPPRRALVRVVGPIVLALAVAAVDVHDATRLRRELLAFDRASLPELRALDGSPLRGNVPADACIRPPGAPPCGPVQLVVAASDRAVSRELAAEEGELVVWLAGRPSDPLGGPVAATPIVVRERTDPVAPGVTREGATYRVHGVWCADLDAAVAALAAASTPAVALDADEDWTAVELVRLCASGCRLR